MAHDMWHIDAVSLLVRPNFSPKLLIAWSSLGPRWTVHLQTIRKSAFGPVPTNMKGPKADSEEFIIT